MSPIYSELTKMILQQEDPTTVVPTNNGGAAQSGDYFGDLFDSPIRIFLIVNNLVGAITTLAVEDKSSLDVVSIMVNAVNKYV